MSHCLKVTSDFHCFFFFCPLKIYGKMYPSHHNDKLNGLYFLSQTVFSVHIKLNKVYTSNSTQDLFCIRFCTQVWWVSCLNESQNQSLMENHSVGCEGDSHKQTTELTSVLPQVHLSLQQMQTTTDNNLLRPILPKHKYLPWQAIRSNQPLHFDGALHTGCIIFWGQVLCYFLFT